MPELPDLEIYIEALKLRLSSATLLKLNIGSPFLLRTVVPGVGEFENTQLIEIRRIGKRLAFGFNTGKWLVIHLMIAGRLQWVDTGKKQAARKSLASFEFSTGTLTLTEAGSKRRASMHLFDNEPAMQVLDRGGLEIFNISENQFKQRLTVRNHTLKRALTDQSLFSGIGNAYSDEILHHANLSPILLTQKMDTQQIGNLFISCQFVLNHWLELLRNETGDSFPKKVTAFKDGMAVHGKYQQPCPVCDTHVQRIRYASNETNYCPRCQTDGKLLADRALSRLLKSDWPKTIEALEDTDPV